MKKILVTILAITAAIPAAFGQGAFGAANINGGGNVYVGSVGGQLAGSEYTVQVFFGLIGAAEETFTSITAPSALFGSTGGALGSGAGWYDFGAVNAQDGQATGPATVQIQYRGAGPGGFAGRSAIVVQNITYSPNQPGDWVATGDWAIVPEPSTLTLAGLGAVALLGLRRRK